MAELGKVYDTVIYPGAGHAFMRRGDDPSTAEDDPNRAARDAALHLPSGVRSGACVRTRPHPPPPTQPHPPTQFHVANPHCHK